MLLNSPRLWVVATPIGNLGDFSPRAQEILGNVHTIFAEDTRRALYLCQQCGISAKRLVSFHDHNEKERQGEALNLLRQGFDIALVSDAGTPLLADPGYRLVRACHDAGICVSPVPGPSAPVAALSAAGLPPLPYTFLGFLPRQAHDQEELFSAFASSPTTIVFFDRKDRVAKSLSLAYRILGPRELAICRELTKMHEEFILGRLEALDQLAMQFQGELTILIGPPQQRSRTPEDEVLNLLKAAVALCGKQRDAIRYAQKDICGWSNKELYTLIAALKKETM